MHRFFKPVYQFLFVLLILTSCGGDDPSVTPSSTDIYIAGILYTDGGSAAVYLKNGTMVYLTDGANTTAGVWQIAVSGSDVYAAGFHDGNAVIWKNGNETILGKGRATGLVLANNDVYVCGIADIGGSSGAYWKNGIITKLTDGAITSGIAVSGNDVYVSGHLHPTSFLSHPMVWKNGAASDLPVTNFWGGTTGLAVTNGDVYVTGFAYNQDGATSACYWKNDSFIELTSKNALGSSLSNFVHASPTNLTIAFTGLDSLDGQYFPTAFVSRDGAASSISHAPDQSYPDAMAVVGSDVYLVADVVNSSFARYLFKNGTPIDTLSNNKLSVNTMFVQTK